MMKRGRLVDAVVVLVCEDGDGKSGAAGGGMVPCEVEGKAGKGRRVLNDGCCVAAEPAFETGKLEEVEEGRRKRGADGVKVGASGGMDRKVG